jgi:histone deacetylase complex regulatory component SIN3
VPSQDRRITAEHARDVAMNRDRAVRYVQSIRARLHPGAHRPLSRLLDLYRRRLVSIACLYRHVAMLFEGHSDLAYELEAFVPDGTRAVSMRQTLMDRHARALMIHGGIGAIDDWHVDDLIRSLQLPNHRDEGSPLI